MTKTKGNVIVEDIKIGDIHFDYSGAFEREVEVLSNPVLDDRDAFNWSALNKDSGEIIKYSVVKGFEQYSPKLYDYPAYSTSQYSNYNN